MASFLVMPLVQPAFVRAPCLLDGTTMHARAQRAAVTRAATLHMMADESPQALFSPERWTDRGYALVQQLP